MFARVTMFEGPIEQLDAAVAAFSEEVMPWLRESTGFRGWLVLRDPDGDKALGISFWASEEAMADKDASGANLRDEVATSFGAAMSGPEFYEVMVADHVVLDEVSST